MISIKTIQPVKKPHIIRKMKGTYCPECYNKLRRENPNLYIVKVERKIKCSRCNRKVKRAFLVVEKVEQN
jgi:hypothetical protein